ncbi:transposase [Mesorhizobium sp.]|uniref:IS66-like element accessory protein TnpA n=1 Tax=Mesorhizobium sp. TaxID=1871066 RepID=UPI000FE84208|nr:transposase [Mesorhizobium sp.]RWF86831.1 MAG: transposase [Mesorhizobium sp.]RWF87180.1 MAG: transposase [Mesorhizobium sp.]RWJ56940.1 MAG: transposase [Mesorhizobium sp.]RWJ63135.1 MAG: transposase [Mesorhizobium sp.]RWJ92558.1 MAG: transposase [Mesorhizobium sp.]
MPISELTLKPRDEEPVRRLEIFTGAGRRREWPPEEKARIVAESYEADETVCGIARRNGLTPQQLFTWRRSARKRLEVKAPTTFVPAVVIAPEPVVAKEPKPRAKRRAPRRRDATIELEASGIKVRIGDSTSPAAIAAVTLTPTSPTS